MNIDFYEQVRALGYALHINKGKAEVIFPPGSLQIRLNPRKRNQAAKWANFDYDVLIPVGLQLTPRQMILKALLSAGVTYWSMRDFCHALNIDYSPRIAGEIGKDAKLLGAQSRKLSFIYDDLTRKRYNRCVIVADPDYIQEKQKVIRMRYREEAPMRIVALQNIRAGTQRQ